jgi:4-hydroxybenzoate polyprenyltransferase
MYAVIKHYVELMRIKHWVKAAFVFAPLVFSFNFCKPDYLLRTSQMAASFCLMASAVYIVNDIFDRNRDRRHPKKRYRPLACGALPVGKAILLAAALFVLAAGLALILNTAALLVILAYFGINIIYSLILKNETFIDVMVIATGFLLRVTAGAAAIGVQPSHWMLLTTFFLSLFLGFGKRRKEMIVTGGSPGHRFVFQHYSVELLNCLIIVSATLTIIAYSLYTVTYRATGVQGTHRFIATIPFVVFGVFRYLYLIYRENNGGDPAEVLLKDRVILLNISLWIMTVFLLLVLIMRSGGTS